jgi:hypothetical protein
MQKFLIIALLLTPFAKADIVKGVEYVETGNFNNHIVADITVNKEYRASWNCNERQYSSLIVCKAGKNIEIYDIANNTRKIFKIRFNV